MHLYNYCTIKIDIDFTQCVCFYFSDIVQTHCSTNQANRKIKRKKKKGRGNNLWEETESHSVYRQKNERKNTYRKKGLLIHRKSPQ